MTTSIRPICLAILITAFGFGTTRAGTNLIIESDFDDLSVGTAPDNEEDAGRWTITYTHPDVPLELREDYPEILTIVPTASFAPGGKGNSLRVESMDANTQTTLHFDEELFVFDVDADFFRASFDVYMPDLGDGRRGAPYISLGSNDTIYSLQPEDRGPHVYWDARGRFRSHTTEFAGGTRTIVSETPLDEWQHVQLDIDLVNDTYDIFWSAGDSALELVKTYVPFQADTDLTAINRIQITTYPIDEVTDANGVGYVDNVRIEAIHIDWLGDANLDGEFNSSDLVDVFAVNLYETGKRAAWSQGDWNRDRRFDSGDLVAAFQDGGYEKGLRGGVAAVPEPAAGSIGLCLTAWLVCYARRRDR